MKIEQQRGISVTSSVMTFEYDGAVFNLLDTPGHEDFSEDTYRTLTAVDSAVMVIDAAKGIEAQTRKLFEVCRLRDVPIITFINKLDREGRDPFELLDEIETTLALDVDAGDLADRLGPELPGHLRSRRQPLLVFDGDRTARRIGEVIENYEHRPTRGWPRRSRWCAGSPAFDLRVLSRRPPDAGLLRQRLNNFGVRELLDALADWAPPPRPQPAEPRPIEPTEPKVTGFVFKVQANMDPQHRDRIAFLRLCSGRFRRGMKLTQMRTGQGAVGQLADPVLRPRARARRGGLAGRHHRHPQPRHAADRRHADRGRGSSRSPASPTSRRKSCAACGSRTR